MNNKLQLPFEPLYILWQLSQAGFEGFIVGGAVRDLLIQALSLDLNNQSNNLPLPVISDFDFATNATPDQVQHIFNNSYYTNEFGTVGIGYDNLISLMTDNGFELPVKNMKNAQSKTDNNGPIKIIDLAKASKIHRSLQNSIKNMEEKQIDTTKIAPFEITTYRSEGLYSDFRRPDQVSWGKSIQEDLSRRDFTINAIALKIDSATLNKIFSNKKISQPLIVLEPQQYTLVDEFNGLDSLMNKQIITVREPDKRFKEDALRMLRAIRFACQLNFEIDELALASIKTNAQLIKKISAERVAQEFLLMLGTNQPDKGIRLLHQTGLLSYIMPELTLGIGVEQGGHHNTNVWVHELDALKNCPSNDPIVRLATLLHDVGKPETSKNENGQITFYNHEIVSSRIADNIAVRFKLSNEDREKLFRLVRYHMFHYEAHQTDAAIRRMIKRIGLEYIDDILALREADRLGSGARQTSWRLEELKQRIVEQLNQPLEITDLDIDGNDLIKELNLSPGPIIGKILSSLFALVLDNPELNEKQTLLKLARETVKKL